MISVVMTVYNSEKYLRAMVESVLRQTYTDLELVLVDNGSTDSSGQICASYEKKDKRVKVKRIDVNKGVGNARNVGYKLTKGEYISFVDSDDYLHPQMYEILINTAMKTSADVISGKAVQIVEKETIPESIIDIDHTSYTLLSQYELFEDIFHRKKRIRQEIWNKLYSRSCIGDTIFSIDGAEDWLFNVEIFQKKIIAVHVNTENGLYYWIRHSSSVVNSGFNEYLVSACKTYLTGWTTGKTSPEIDRMALLRIHKEILDFLYWAKNTQYCDKTKRTVKENKGGFQKNFYVCKSISLWEKTVYTVLLYFPITYSAYRRIVEYKNKCWRLGS